MQNQPMSSGDQSKILIFSLLMVPSIFFGVGIIPSIFLFFGIYMMKRNQDFTSIDTTVKLFKGYVGIAIIGCAMSSIYWGNKHFFNDWHYYRAEDMFQMSIFFTVIGFVYLTAVQFLFYSPMNRHREWIAVNGIFSTKPRLNSDSTSQSEVDIIKGEKLKQYSVADELIKWAKLKEDGHISEEEFKEVRTKLMKRN